MSACLPKHIVCHTYIPNFTPSPQNCVLQDTAERRARLAIGGTFFRSLNFGIAENNITISCDWFTGLLGAGSLTTDPSLVQSVRLILVKDTLTETYYANQSYDSLLMTWTSAISSLRSQLASSAIATMPLTDGISYWNAPIKEADPLSHIDFFNTTNMNGASPPGPSSAIRTGPIYTILRFASTEDGNGNAVSINYIKYWNSKNWVFFAPNNDCYDPNNLPPNLC